MEIKHIYISSLNCNPQINSFTKKAYTTVNFNASFIAAIGRTRALWSPVKVSVHVTAYNLYNSCILFIRSGERRKYPKYYTTRGAENSRLKYSIGKFMVKDPANIANGADERLKKRYRK